MSHPICEITRKYPFDNMKIDDNSILNQIEGRSKCSKCGRSRKFFCYTCYIPVQILEKQIPRINLPVKIDIIKHKNEIDGKSTAVHAPILAPDDCRIFTYPDIPDYQGEDAVLIYPGAKSLTVNQLFNENINTAKNDDFGKDKGFNMGTLLRSRIHEINDKDIRPTLQTYTWEGLIIKRAIFIDSTWNQSRSIYKDDRIKNLKSVVLQNRASQFWRHQKGSPRWYLATIEAIHQFLLEVHTNAWGLDRRYLGLANLEICHDFYKYVKLLHHSSELISPTSPYNGHYDNLLYFFSNMYDLIHTQYDHNQLKSYKRHF